MLGRWVMVLAQKFSLLPAWSSDDALIHFYLDIRSELIAREYAPEIDWSESLHEPTDPDVFGMEAIFVICNSGMKAQIARPIFDRIMVALRAGAAAGSVFGHAGKSGAIDHIWANRAALLAKYKA